MRFELGVALRYLRSGHKSKFISAVTIFSVLGVAVGVMALIIVLAVMSGFDNDLREKIVGVNPQVYVQAAEGITFPYEVIKEIKDIEHVVAASPFIEGQALLFKNKYAQGVMMRGINSQLEPEVTRLREYLIAGYLPEAENSILVGKELARTFNLGVGSIITVVSPVKEKKYKFTVCGIFNTGMYDYDASWTYISLSDAGTFFDTDGAVSAVGVKIDDLFKAEEVKKDILKKLGYSYWVRTWMEVNRSFFSSLKLEKTVMFIIVALIVMVASFNIISTLIMMVMEKTKDIGILKSLGASRISIALIFTFCGVIIGTLGTVVGAGSGFLACHLLEKYEFIKLPADIYYVSTLPVQIQWNDSILIAVSAVALSFLATLYPAYQAAGLNPVEALRYE
ncbi:MAG: ABC transporter permease [Candidatus Omnitrophica bacterium]|nr:ABC transporter permease [Candidatus Omnitrophota bacterium]